MFHTFQKGAIGLMAVSQKLIEMGMHPFIPMIEQTSCDLVVLNPKNNKLYKFQIKYVSAKNGTFQIKNQSGYFHANKTYRTYKKSDFDFYGIYESNTKKVYFAPFYMGGKYIRIIPPIVDCEFNWHEDFVNFPPQKTKTKNLKDIEIVSTRKRNEQHIF